MGCDALGESGRATSLSDGILAVDRDTLLGMGRLTTERLRDVVALVAATVGALAGAAIGAVLGTETIGVINEVSTMGSGSPLVEATYQVGPAPVVVLGGAAVGGGLALVLPALVRAIVARLRHR